MTGGESAHGVALVFGGRSPIAVACAKNLARFQKVILVSREHGDDLTELLSGSTNIEVLEANLEKVGEGKRVVDATYARGLEPSAVVFFQRYRSTKRYDFTEHCAVELWAVAEVLDQIRLRKSPASIVQTLISSSPAAGRVVGDQDIEYHVVKAGQEALVRFYAVQLASVNISVNAARIGSVVIKARASSYWDSVPALVAGLQEISPSGTLQTSEEVGNLFGGLVSAELPGVTGQIFEIDGGLSLLDGGQLVKRILEGRGQVA